jgi:hypothetical protein
MSRSTMTLSDDTHALGVHAKISGRSSTTVTVGRKTDGRTEETDKETKTVITDLPQYEAATALVGKLRGCLTRYATNVEPVGFVTDSARLAEFNAAIEEVEAEITAHNERLNQPHPIAHDIMRLSIGRIMDEGTQRSLCRTVSEALTEAKGMLQAGDVKALGYWLQHRKNIASLMPRIVGRVVECAIEQLTVQRKRVTKLIKDGERLPADAGALAETDQVDDALAWVETSQSGVQPDAAVSH